MMMKAPMRALLIAAMLLALLAGFGNGALAQVEESQTAVPFAERRQKAIVKWLKSPKPARGGNEKMNQVLKLSKKFWEDLEAADVEAMRSVCDPDCYFVHIGGNCDLDKEMNAFAEKIFQPIEVVLNQQEVKDIGDTAIVISDVDYGLLLDGKPTTHHFATTEVFHLQSGAWKLIQFTFTALVY